MWGFLCVDYINDANDIITPPKEGEAVDRWENYVATRRPSLVTASNQSGTQTVLSVGPDYIHSHTQRSSFTRSSSGPSVRKKWVKAPREERVQRKMSLKEGGLGIEGQIWGKSQRVGESDVGIFKGSFRHGNEHSQHSLSSAPTHHEAHVTANSDRRRLSLVATSAVAAPLGNCYNIFCLLNHNLTQLLFPHSFILTHTQ